MREGGGCAKMLEPQAIRLGLSSREDPVQVLAKKANPLRTVATVRFSIAVTASPTDTTLRKRADDGANESATTIMILPTF